MVVAAPTDVDELMLELRERVEVEPAVVLKVPRGGMFLPFDCCSVFRYVMYGIQYSSCLIIVKHYSNCFLCFDTSNLNNKYYYIFYFAIFRID